jgi:hypothetical protein
MKTILPSSIEKKRPGVSRGYTLFESLIALAILITVTVPLTAFFHRKADAARLMQSITAVCILEHVLTTDNGRFFD